MSIKIEFDHEGKKVFLECHDGINVVLNGCYEKVDSEKLEKSLLFMVKILRITNSEQQSDDCLPSSFQDYMELIISKEDFYKNRIGGDKIIKWCHRENRKDRRKILDLARKIVCMTRVEG